MKLIRKCQILVIICAIFFLNENCFSQEIYIDSTYLPLITNTKYTYIGFYNGKEDIKCLEVKSANLSGNCNSFYFENANESMIIGSTMVGLGMLLWDRDGLYTIETFWKSEIPQKHCMQKQKLLSKYMISDKEIEYVGNNSNPIYHLKLVGLENVIVPAGSFNDCLKIRIQAKWDNNKEYIEYLWLAKNIGLVRWIKGTGRVEELLNYGHDCDSSYFNKLEINYSDKYFENEKEKKTNSTPKINTDVGFAPFIAEVVSKANFRIEPSKNSIIICQLPEKTQLYVFSNIDANGFYKVIDINTSKIGWVSKSLVKWSDAVDINYKGSFQTTGSTSNYNSEVIIRNKSAYKITLVVGGQIYYLNPNSIETKSITPGKMYYIATAPGVIPTSGFQTFSSYQGYEWEFWVETKRY